MGYDSVFPAYKDYNQMWLKNEGEEYKQFDVSLLPRSKRAPVYRALYGLGCVTSSFLIRSGKLVGGKVGILSVNEWEYTIRDRADRPEV